MEAAADRRYDALVALPGDLGPLAHGRRQEYDHHPRRRQPARPALAVLGQRSAALLYRLGQDDPARLWPRPGDGGEARAPRQALYQLLGRRGDRLYRDGFRNRGQGAPADPVDPVKQLLDGDRIEG